MKKNQNLKCKQKLWESFNPFAISDNERTKEVVERLSGDENKWLNGCDDRWSVGEKKALWEPSTRAPTLKCAHFVKSRYRLMAVTSMSVPHFLYLRFVFTLQDHVVPKLLGNFTNILNRRAHICSLRNIQ